MRADPAGQIRRARPGDAPGIQALEDSFPSDRLSLRSVRRLLQSPSAGVWVAVRPGAPVIAGAMILLTRRGSRCARIYSLVVHPAARGRGLAQRLVRRAEAEARRHGCEQMSLEVRGDNRAAQALYAALGYTGIRRLPGYYEDGADGLRLGRQLKPESARTRRFSR